MHIVDFYVKATEKGENRDNSTGGHIKRMRSYVNLILHGMRYNKRYQDNDKIKLTVIKLKNIIYVYYLENKMNG